MPIQRSDPPTTKVVYISRSGEPLIRHTIHIADLGSDFDWWCSCRLINGSEKSSAQDAEHDAVQLHESQGEPITRPYSAPGMPAGAPERAREIAETLPTVGQWPAPDHSPGAAGVLPGVTCAIPGHCDGDNAPYVGGCDGCGHPAGSHGDEGCNDQLEMAHSSRPCPCLLAPWQVAPTTGSNPGGAS